MINIFSQIDIKQSELNIPKTATADDTTINSVLQLVFAIGASVAFIVIIIAGIQFILSRGDPGKTATARSTIIYAAVGLVLASSAYSIVRFVLGKV
jgi:hypothetical protein